MLLRGSPSFLPLFVLLRVSLGVRRGQRHSASERGAEHRPRYKAQITHV